MPTPTATKTHPTHVIHKGQKLKVVGRFGHLQYMVEIDGKKHAVPILECQTITEKPDPLADAAKAVETKTAELPAHVSDDGKELIPAQTVAVVVPPMAPLGKVTLTPPAPKPAAKPKVAKKK